MPHWSSLARDQSSSFTLSAAAAHLHALLGPLVRTPHHDVMLHASVLRDTSTSSTGGHNVGTLAGIFVGVLVAFMAMIAVCYYFYRRERMSERRQREPATLQPDDIAHFSRQMRRAQTSYYLCGNESYQNLRAGSRLLLSTVDGNGRPIRLESPRLADLRAARRLVSTGGALVTFPPSAPVARAYAPPSPPTQRRRVHLYYRDCPPKGEEGSVCMICLESLEGGVIVAGECLHWTHEECLKGWLAKSPQLDCPGCRSKLVESSSSEE